MIKLGAVIPEINVGGIYFAEGRSQISKTVYVDDAMIDVFKQLHALNVKLEVRATPSDTSQDLMSLL